MSATIPSTTRKPAGTQNYSDNSHPATDVGGLNAQVNPNFDESRRTMSASMTSRCGSGRRPRARSWNCIAPRYTPKPGSPLIDTGHGGNGNDIGAVGAGAVNPDDQFGILTP